MQIKYSTHTIIFLGLAAVPGIIQLVGFLYLPESPRWLYARVGSVECERVLKKVYNGDEKWIHYEMEEIKRAHEEQETGAVQGNGNLLSRIFSSPPVRRALFLGCAAQAFQQIAGINTIMYYTGSIIRSAGVRDYHTIIWISTLTSSVNFLCTLVPMYLVERVGRRPLLLASMIGTIVSLCLMGGAFFLINIDSTPVTASTLQPSLFGDEITDGMVRCTAHSNCDYCVTDEHCGFCPLVPVGEESTNGICVPRSLHAYTSPNCLLLAQQLNATGTNKTLRDDVEMETNCRTRFTALPIVLMVVYLCCFSIGASYASEIPHSCP